MCFANSSEPMVDLYNVFGEDFAAGSVLGNTIVVVVAWVAGSSKAAK